VAIPDLGLYHATKGGLLFAAIKGAVDAGLEIRTTRKYSVQDRIMARILIIQKNQYRRTIYGCKAKDRGEFNE